MTLLPDEAFQDQRNSQKQIYFIFNSVLSTMPLINGPLLELTSDFPLNSSYWKPRHWSFLPGCPLCLFCLSFWYFLVAFRVVPVGTNAATMFIHSQQTTNQWEHFKNIMAAETPYATKTNKTLDQRSPFIGKVSNDWRPSPVTNLNIDPSN